MSYFKALVEILVIILLCYGVYREKDLIEFERKIAMYIKAFFKALYYTIKEKQTKAAK